MPTSEQLPIRMPSSDPGTDSDNNRTRIVWKEEELTIMADKLETFRAKERTKEERRKIVQKVCKAIKPFNEGLSDAEWVLKKKAIKAWMCNNGRQLKDKDLFTFANSWSTRRVVGFLEKPKVYEKAKAASGRRPGHPDFFGYYQVSLTEVIDELAPDQLKHYERLAAKWNLVGCPPDAQQSNWKSTGRKFLQGITKCAWQQYGMRMVIAASVKDSDGVRVLTFYDDNGKYGSEPVQSMEKHLPAPSYKKFVDAWNEYSQYTAGIDDTKDSAATSKIMTTRKQRLPMEFDDDGMPILPPASNISGANKEIIRSYLIEHYRLASGKKKTIVPWTEVNRNPHAFIDKLLFPPDVNMADPSKLTNGDAEAFVTLWHQVPFEFKAYQDKDGFHPSIYANRPKPAQASKKKARFADKVSIQDAPQNQTRGTANTESRPKTEVNKISIHSEPGESDSEVPKSDIDSDDDSTGAPLANPTPAESKSTKRTTSKSISMESSDGESSDGGITSPTPKPKTSRFVNPRTSKGHSVVKTPDNVSQPAKITTTRGQAKDKVDVPPPPKTSKTKVFPTLQNPIPPPTPRTTRSMTASPVKRKMEVVIPRQSKQNITERPKPKPVGKSKAKEGEEQIEETMRRTSKRTLALAQASTPAKRRRRA